MFDHILVTTDGSALGNLALPVAADLARKYDSALTLLYVTPQLLMLLEGAAYTYDYPAERSRTIAEGQEILAAAEKTLDYPQTKVVLLEENDLKTEQAILNEVERSGANLVVMSTHGRSGLAHLFLGSVAEAVLKKIRVPLLLIQAPDRAIHQAPAGKQAPVEMPSEVQGDGAQAVV
jgi:nucleotide-binding universal stress UspA family protein